MAIRYQPTSRQASIGISLTLSGMARKTVLALPAADLKKNDGMTTLVGKLDKLFLKEANDCAYEAYQNVDSFLKSDEMIMTDYIIGFLETKVHTHKELKLFE